MTWKLFGFLLRTRTHLTPWSDLKQDNKCGSVARAQIEFVRIGYKEPLLLRSAFLFGGIEYESEERDACSLHAIASLSRIFVSRSNFTQGKCARKDLTDVSSRVYVRKTALRSSPGPMAAPRPSAARDTNWEGGYRIPCAIRWPGVIKPGTIDNNIYSHEDMLPTLLAAAGDLAVTAKLLKGMKVSNKTFKVHLDGYNITDSLAGRGPDPRHEFFYWNDEGSLVALRYNQWKIVFQEQRAEGSDVWSEPFVPLRVPKLFNLRSDPFEEADRSAMDWRHWQTDRVFVLVPAQEYVAKYIATFREFPPSQKVGSFSLDQVLQKLQEAGGGQK